MSTGATAVSDPHAETLRSLAAALGEDRFTTTSFRDNLRIHVAADRLIPALRALKDSSGFASLAEARDLERWKSGLPPPDFWRYKIVTSLRVVEL